MKLNLIVSENNRISVPATETQELKLKEGSKVTIKSMIGPNGKVENLIAMIGPNGMIQIPKDVVTKLGIKKGVKVEIELQSRDTNPATWKSGNK